MGCKQWLPIRRPVFLLFSFLLILMSFEFLFMGQFTTLPLESFNPYDERPEWFESSNQSTFCDLPFHMNPYDPIIKVHIRRANHDFDCSGPANGANNYMYNLFKGESLSYMNDYDPIVRIFRIKDHERSLKCLYQTFGREGDSDDRIAYFEERPISGHKLNLEKIGAEFVIIKCFLSGKLVYKNIHSWPSRVSGPNKQKPPPFSSTSPSPLHPQPPIAQSAKWKSMSPKARIRRKGNKSHANRINPYQPSVMFLIIESMSYLNFKRFMFQTNEALSKLSNLFLLRGLNKMADNSYPNMMPILSGYRPYYEEWPGGDNHSVPESGPYDGVPFIWKDFKRANYSTGYIEDCPTFSLFNYLAKGFAQPPVDWYTRPYWLQMDKEQGIEALTDCYKQKPKIVHWLKQVKQFLNKVHSTRQPFFLWSFFIQVTHTDFNRAQLLDPYLAQFINEYRPILEETVFILMGDHGNRYGPQLETSYGQIETRMPLFSIHIPPELLLRHPHLADYLKKNEKKLTTWLDVREMLKDIVHGDFDEIVSTSEQRKAYSLWREEVSPRRTCKDALIPMEFCLCSKRFNQPVNSSIAVDASHLIVDQLNQNLTKFANLCEQLSLNEILSVKKIYLDEQTSDRYEIILSVNPSDALLQAQVYRQNNHWVLEGDVSRLNSYGNQSICIEDRVARKYCYCPKSISTFPAL